MGSRGLDAILIEMPELVSAFGLASRKRGTEQGWHRPKILSRDNTNCPELRIAYQDNIKPTLKISIGQILSIVLMDFRRSITLLAVITC